MLFCKLGVLSEDLNLFLETNLPKPEKKGKKDSFVLGVSEPKLGASISEILGITCQHAGVIPEIVRGIRLHFAHLVKGICFCNCDQSFQLIIFIYCQVSLCKLLELLNLVWVTATHEPKLSLMSTGLTI